MASESKNQNCQVLVIGAGPGGYLAAIRLAQLKRDVILLEREKTLGGVCLNEGCIPSKALIHAADFIAEAQGASAMGIRIQGYSIDIKALVEWKNQIVKRLTQGVKLLVEKNGARIVNGTGKFLSERTAQVSNGEQTTTIAFEQAIIATGSSPMGLRNFPIDGEHIIGSSEALSLESIPKSLAVIGAGYIGLELGTVFKKFGSEVTFIETRDSLVPDLDREVGDSLTARLKKLGISLFLGHFAESYTPGDPCRMTIRDSQGKEKEIAADKILVSIGRIPATRDLGLERVGVELDAKGFIKVNPSLETNIHGIYAIGDVIGGPLLAHKAYRQAKVVAEIVAGEQSAFDNVVVPAAIYTDPEIAWAGLSEKEAKEEGLEIVTGTFPLRASGRALTLNAPEGFVKTIADAKTRLIRGVVMVGHGVSELISEAALALEMGAFLEDLHATIHPHPTLSEALLESVDAALGQAIHILKL
jgi:dihydrolipoyl dehydrogenase